jgi:hypothetical protein
MVSYTFVALVVFGWGTAAAQNLQPLYVPLVFAATGSTLEPGGYVVDIQRWESTMSVFNPTDSPATVIDVAVYGKGAVLTQVPRPPIQPHQGNGLVPSVVPVPDRGVGFLELRMSPGVVFYADVQSVTRRCAVGSPLCDELVHGQVNMPFYRALFPPGSVAVSGAVELGYFGLPKAVYSPEVERHRRMNVTLFNAGDAPASFVVRTFPHNRSAVSLTEQTVIVEAKDVFQVNGFPVPTEASIPMQSVNGGNQIWVTITADQPFLSYVSTIFNAVESGDLPFQVYPSFLQN